MILTVVRNLYKQTQGPLVRSSADEPAVASQPLTCRVGVEDSALPSAVSLSLGCRVLTSPPPPHTYLKTTLMSQSSVCSISDTQGCHTSFVVTEFCKLSSAKPQLSQMCI